MGTEDDGAESHYHPVEKFILEPLRDLPEDQQGYYFELYCRRDDIAIEVERLEGMLKLAHEAINVLDAEIDREGEFEHRGVEGQRIWEPPIDPQDLADEAALPLAEELAAKAARDRQVAARGALTVKNKTESERRRQALRDKWATGQYKTKEQCAYEEAGALGIGPEWAQRLLNNAPNPSPWPARNLP